MSKIAIDIVLLPPEDIMDKAIEINNDLKDDPIRMNKENCLPHISLCMGVMKEEELSEIKKIVDRIAFSHSGLSLTINKINGKNVCFEVKSNLDLQKLHELMMESLADYLSYDSTAEMFLSPPKISERTPSWTNKYRNNSSFKNFYPHITLGDAGISKLRDKELNIKFKVSKIAICHLGNYCTCRKILHSVNLS
jgi:2'-5' RNA ligase